MRKLLALTICTILMTSCTNKEKTSLQGHYYFLEPLTSLRKTKMTLMMATATHHYISSNEVEVTNYIAGEPNKKEIMHYTIDGSAYTLEDEKFDIKKDTGNNFVLSIDNIPAWELEYIK